MYRFWHMRTRPVHSTFDTRAIENVGQRTPWVEEMGQKATRGRQVPPDLSDCPDD